ncbi:hypothetical protein BDW59DRAFT_160052 [Aspergillus cavernicola]|uniref:Uncharacterized protein n=1 Tax=Aspergillus cavernicola TaxID=176166 RepID=A0ABR4IJ03_9EURO
MSLAHTAYFHLATTVASYPLANSVLIFLCSLPPVLLGRYYDQTQTQNQGKTCRYYPLWLSLLLLVSPALEFPLIFTLHPVTIAYTTHPVELPSPERLTLQVLGFFLMEALCHRLILPLVVSMTTSLYHEQEEHNADDGMITAAIMDFSTPRIALMLGIAVIGIPCSLTRCLGRLHPLSMAGWVIVDQNLSMLAHCKTM